MRTDDFVSEERAGDCDERTVSEATAGPAPRSREQSRRAALIRTIEGEMVPRLLMLCREAGVERVRAADPATGPWSSSPWNPGPWTPGAGDVGEWDVEELARLLVAHGPEMAREFVETVRQRGVPYESICVELLAPTARRLAEQWEHWNLGYSDLALSLGNLTAVVMEIGAAGKIDSNIACQR
jgi:hypothetical protein